MSLPDPFGLFLYEPQARLEKAGGHLFHVDKPVVGLFDLGVVAFGQLLSVRAFRLSGYTLSRLKTRLNETGLFQTANRQNPL